MIRYRMHKIIRLLESENNESVRALLISNRKYKEAFNNLVKIDVVAASYCDDEIDDFELNETEAAYYALCREDAFKNRAVGFISGIVATLIASYFVNLLIG